MPATLLEPHVQSVELGQQAVVTGDSLLTTLVGSCVVVVVWDETTQTAAMAHLVLPFSQGLTSQPERFADRAVTLLLNRLRDLDIPLQRVVAKIAGGAQLVDTNDPADSIGRQIVDVATAALQEDEVRVVATDVGGQSGRRIEFRCATGVLVVVNGEGEETFL